MDSIATPTAWLETADGERLPLEGTASLGRSRSVNQFAFAHEKISRRHALIHAQEAGEFWILDLGSTNGTYVGEHRVIVATRLYDGSKVSLGHGVELVFHQPISAEEARAQAEPGETVVDVRMEMRWLLIVDVVDFSGLDKRMPPAQLAKTVGEWLAAGTDLLTARGGRVNKYTGDGFLGFWQDTPEMLPEVARALADFHKMRNRYELPFRVIVHRGIVVIGGAPTLGEESLHSHDVTFAFRLEKLAASLKLPYLLSSAAAQGLAPHVKLVAVPGSHELKGFRPVTDLATLEFAEG